MHSYDPNHDATSHPHYSSSAAAPFRLDEGFSEDASQDEHGRNAFAATAASFQAWVMAQNEETRSEIAYEILRTLRTSNIAGVVDKLTPLLHMDPLGKLPPEITSEIFSYLDATTLLTASLASQKWRERILDTRLWQQLYKSQGWGIDSNEVRAFEEAHSTLVRSEFRKARGQFRGSQLGKGHPQFKKRATSDWLESKGRKASADVSQWREQHGVIEADTDGPSDNGDHEMRDVPANTQDSPQRPNKRHSQDSGDEMDIYPEPSTARRNEHAADATISSTQSARQQLLLEDASGNERMNWPYLYKQRQRLEQNWAKGRFTNFQLPHPQHVYEAHTECVYTIQFYGKWLVSGSRDKTLRVWDLETRRLRGKPLTGHSQSVLCLQFDPSEDEDVIISGSSDSSIIVWRFSTGQKIHEIPSAHEESVLNLRFDRRHLVTCSKDKKIKIWTRLSLSPLDPDYPKMTPNHAKMPSYIVDVASMDPSLLEARLANGAIKSLRPYSHLMTLEGHGAAVNAIQINGDLVVSASGDRLIKVWSVRDGKCIRTLPGHQKGIACVQFDSQRIVSGSSDNTVRIYDPTTGAEVAVLHGHTNLVRTVQAGFGDIPGDAEENAAAARAAEKNYFLGVAMGTIVEDRHQRRRMRQGELSSSRVAINSRLPPGGGGSKWGRIVSGSYDESIIIWKKDANGHWIIGQTLRQETAVRASTEAAQAGTTADDATSQASRGSASSAGAVAVRGAAQMPIMSPSQIVQHAMSTSSAVLSSGIQNMVNLNRGMSASLATWNIPPRSSSGPVGPPNILAPAVQQAMHQMAQHAQNMTQHAVQQARQQSPNMGHGHTYHQQATQSGSGSHAGPSQQQQQQAPSQSQSTSTSTPAPSSASASAPALQAQTSTITSAPASNQPTASTVAMPSTITTAPTPAPASQAPPQAPTAAAAQSVSRVFKLQFDARRIVCCSQDSRIIGWDFANGDPEIIESSRFFLGP